MKENRANAPKETSMQFSFLEDLDEYFCEKYANYDKLCILDGYEMPVMQATKLDVFGRTYAYTLPAETMRLSLQKNKTELLKQLKTKLTDKSFSFSFRPLSFWEKISDLFAKITFKKEFEKLLGRYNLTPEQAKNGLDVDEQIWNSIVKGGAHPTKNLIFSFALVQHISLKDTNRLLAVCGHEFDFTQEKDVVVSYLLSNSVFNADMVASALQEYHIKNLFIKAE
jgi:hypothetical protein